MGVESDYFVAWLVRERLMETQAAAERARLMGSSRPPRTPLRPALGAALAKLDQGLLGSDGRPDRPALTDPRRS